MLVTVNTWCYRCPVYDNLPPECSLVTDPKDQCCRIPSCQFVPTQGQITGTLSPNMIPTAVPGKITGQVPTPTPGPDGKTPTPISKYFMIITRTEPIDYNSESSKGLVVYYRGGA